MLVNREIVLSGFDANSDESDGLVLWVAGDEGAVDRITKAMGNKIKNVENLDVGFDFPLSFEEGLALGFDYDLPKDEMAFIEEVNKKVASYALRLT